MNKVSINVLVFTEKLYNTEFEKTIVFHNYFLENSRNFRVRSLFPDHFEIAKKNKMDISPPTHNPRTWFLLQERDHPEIFNKFSSRIFIICMSFSVFFQILPWRETLDLLKSTAFHGTKNKVRRRHFI